MPKDNHFSNTKWNTLVYYIQGVKSSEGNSVTGGKKVALNPLNWTITHTAFLSDFSSCQEDARSNRPTPFSLLLSPLLCLRMTPLLSCQAVIQCSGLLFTRLINTVWCAFFPFFFSQIHRLSWMRIHTAMWFRSLWSQSWNGHKAQTIWPIGLWSWISKRTASDCNEV